MSICKGFVVDFEYVFFVSENQRKKYRDILFNLRNGLNTIGASKNT